jgi:anti-sigma-K factor RskA
MNGQLDTGDLHLLTGAYAAGALSDEEHDAFVAHLLTCAQCRDEVAELVATATLLGIAAAETPPPGVRDRVMAEVAHTRQLPPVVTTLAEAREQRRSRLSRRWTTSAAAAVAVLAVGLGAWGYALSQENSDLRRQENLIAAVQTAPDAKTITASAGGATATVTVSRSTGEMLFMTHGLQDIGRDRTYQVWLLGPGSTVRSAGTFNSDGKGHTTKLFPGPGDAFAVAVTEEPAGGSERPTTKPVMAMDLPRQA